MKVAQITLWDGSKIFSDRFDHEYLRTIIANAKNMFQKRNIPITHEIGEVKIVDMDENDYFHIPATNESAEIFGDVL